MTSSSWTTPAKCRSRACPRHVHTIHLPARVSVGAARNAAVEHTSTPYVLFLDADDRLLPGTLAFLVDQPRREAVGRRFRLQAHSLGSAHRSARDRRPVAEAGRLPTRPLPTPIRPGHTALEYLPDCGLRCDPHRRIPRRWRLRRRQPRRGLGVVRGARVARQDPLLPQAGPPLRRRGRLALAPPPPTSPIRGTASSVSAAGGCRPTRTCLRQASAAPLHPPRALTRHRSPDGGRQLPASDDGTPRPKIGATTRRPAKLTDRRGATVTCRGPRFPTSACGSCPVRTMAATTPAHPFKFQVQIANGLALQTIPSGTGPTRRLRTRGTCRGCRRSRWLRSSSGFRAPAYRW